jgi:hypothetical protein
MDRTTAGRQRDRAREMREQRRRPSVHLRRRIAAAPRLVFSFELPFEEIDCPPLASAATSSIPRARIGASQRATW